MFCFECYSCKTGITQLQPARVGRRYANFRGEDYAIFFTYNYKRVKIFWFSLHISFWMPFVQNGRYSAATRARRETLRELQRRRFCHFLYTSSKRVKIYRFSLHVFLIAIRAKRTSISLFYSAAIRARSHYQYKIWIGTRQETLRELQRRRFCHFLYMLSYNIMIVSTF
jgi:hypothetical protein